MQGDGTPPVELLYFSCNFHKKSLAKQESIPVGGVEFAAVAIGEGDSPGGLSVMWGGGVSAQRVPAMEVCLPGGCKSQHALRQTPFPSYERND